MGIVEELGTIAMVTQALRTGPALVELKHPLKKKKKHSCPGWFDSVVSVVRSWARGLKGPGFDFS